MRGRQTFGVLFWSVGPNVADIEVSMHRELSGQKIGRCSVTIGRSTLDNEANASIASTIDPDRPIETREADRLGRSSYADAIARYIRSVPADNGFAIAVMGEWGSGKSSVLNMAAEVLDAGGEGVVLLWFNPWLSGGTSELVARFFSELGAQLGQQGPENLKEVAKQLTRLGQSLAPLSPLPGTTSVAFLLAQLAQVWAKSPSLLKRRTDLKKLLSQSSTRVVVLIDDVDRLEPAEIREIMRLVRLTSDFPNVVFLLAFDRAKVARSLGDGKQDEGSQYLDKIIQIGYTLPSIRAAHLEGLFFSQLDVLIEGHKVAQLDQQAWSEVYFGIIRPLLRNLRDAKRYLNSLPLIFDSVGEEVALADLLAMEALRILSPDIFKLLRNHASVLVESRVDWKSPEARKEELDNMLDYADRSRNLLASVFRVLFPSTQAILTNTRYGTSFEASWRRDRRIASEGALLIYFQAGLSDDDIPHGTVQEIVGSLADENRLGQLLDAFDSAKLEKAMQLLIDYGGNFTSDTLRVAVPVLLNRLDRLSPEYLGYLDVPPRSMGILAISMILESAGGQGSLDASIGEMIQKVPRLSGRLSLINTVGHREQVGKRLVDPSVAEELERDFLEELKTANVDDLIEEWDLRGISLLPLHWLEGKGRIEVVNRFREHLDDDGFLLALLRAAIHNAFVNRRKVRRLPWRELLEVFGDELLGAVDRLASEMCYCDFSEEEIEAVTLAQRYASENVPSLSELM